MEKTLRSETKHLLCRNKIIYYGDIWDPTKGCPGEGPDDRRGKKQESSTNRGDKRWFNSLKMWGGVPRIHLRDIGHENTIGHDLWYDNEPAITWTNLQSNIISINMAGWGEQSGEDQNSSCNTGRPQEEQWTT